MNCLIMYSAVVNNHWHFIFMDFLAENTMAAQGPFAEVIHRTFNMRQNMAFFA